MTRRVAAVLRGDDKIMVGKQDLSDPQYSNLDDIKEWLNMNPLRKDGYRWHKGEGNTDLAEYEEADEIEGVGAFWPGYRVKGYIKTVPMTDPDQHIILISSVKI